MRVVCLQGATVVDFAYHVHTDVGNHMKAAKVNGKPVHSDYALKNAEVRSPRPVHSDARARVTCQLWSSAHVDACGVLHPQPQLRPCRQAALPCVHVVSAPVPPGP